MLFNSYIFIFLFFPLCITGFYLLAGHDRDVLARIWLIGFSLWFYGFFSPAYLIIMVVSILLNYLLTQFMYRTDKKTGKRAILIAGVIINLGLLGYFKYLDFAISNLNFIFETNIPLKEILLPLGISFFTFQQIGFLADTYRGEAERVGFIDYALFVSFFPQLVAGPIVTQAEMLPQFKTIRGRKPEAEKIARGLSLFILGLSKKVLIADSLGRAVDAGYDMIPQLGGLDSFLVMLWYALQLYFDFSGYCDMARGLAGMLGFELPVNFDSPYQADDITDFWHRWHRTLTRFFTGYVYIPLGGSRRGEVRTIVNILTVYLLSGLWHGAGWNYILWGALHGVAYSIVRTVQRHMHSRGDSARTADDDGAGHPVINPGSTALRSVGRIACRAAGRIVTFLYVSFAWIYFRADSISQGTELIRRMFSGTWRSVNYTLADKFVEIDELWYIVKFSGLPGINFPLAHNLVMIAVTIAALVTVSVVPNADKCVQKMKPGIVNAVLLGVLGLWCVLSLSEVSTFLYFNF